ncbi:DUF5134 domain-containing protein [Streptomyces inusitatus]|uniref:DUF5134 domain-containing protein n=1 Tax=Streptomyces inusitatus TaxID=68221 RepID=A0A918V4N4_9ACTN|nr:DUF5134 domain-containing protein [Streptomyces inusitatus]GGZ64131.1 DUF5134 domain-containing protein [Streptomyces inusitatus]
MHGPALSGWLLVALCGTAGGYCLARMRGCSGAARATAGNEALMGLGMAAMAVPVSSGLALPGWIWPLYAVLFGGAALAGLWSAGRGGSRHLHHLVGSLTMVYMAVAMMPGTAHAGHSAAGVPLVTGALLGYYTVHVLRSGARLVPASAPPPYGAAAPERGPGLVGACRLAMGVAMLAMLLAL